MAQSTNQVTVSAVPFNPQTQTFQSTPTTNSYSMGTVNLNATPVQNTQQTTTIQPKNIPNSMNVSTLNTPKITLPQTQTTSYSPTQNYAQGYAQQQQTAQQNQDQQIVDYNTNLFKTIANLAPELGGQATEKTNQLNALGVPKMNQQLQDLSSQILQRNAELNQADVSLAQGLQNIQDQAIPMQFITGQQASVQNQAQLAKAVKISNINMLNATAQALQGNITLAQQTAQDAVDTKYAPIKDMYNTLIMQQQAIQPLLTSAEKRISEQQSAMYELQKTMLTQKQTQESKFMDLVLKAPTDYGASPEQVSSAISTYQKTGDIMQAAQALSGAGGQYITQQYNTTNGIRNATYNGVGQITIDNGYGLDAFKKGIAGTESSNNYNAIGPATSSGDKAYGKYQVMGANIPAWTKAAGLPSMTPQQFLASPDAQEKVFENQSMTNYAKYGNWDDVASVWFSGRPLANNTSSDGYNTVPQYVSKVRQAMGVPAQPTTYSEVANPTVKYWSDYLKANPTKTVKEAPTYLQTAIIAYDNQNKVNNPQTQAVVEKINQIDQILNNPALSSVVGPNMFSRGSSSVLGVAGKALGSATAGAIGGTFVAPVIGTAIGALGGLAFGAGAAAGQSMPFVTGQAQNFIADVDQLTNQEFIDKLINAKAQGATFGALNEQEGAALRNSATKLNTWAIKDNGQVVGYNIDEASFIAELNKIKRLAQKGVANAGGNILGGTLTDSYFNNVIPQVSATTSTTANYGGYQF